MRNFSHLQVFICDNRPFIDSISPFVARKDVQGKLLSLLAPCPFYDFSEWISKEFPKFYWMGRIMDFAKGPLGNLRGGCTTYGPPTNVSFHVDHTFLGIRLRNQRRAGVFLRLYVLLLLSR